MMKKRSLQRLFVAVLAFLPVPGVLYLYFFGIYYYQPSVKYYEKNTMEVGKEITKREIHTVAYEVDGIILINKEHALPERYEVELVTLPDKVNRADRKAYGPLMEMIREGQKQGLQFEICSSYRSVERQIELFEEDVEELMREGYSHEEAYKEVARETMPPGCSEHSTGLAFDIVALNYQLLDQWQENTPENIWLQENCARFGFILRYPKGKEDITRISYESWHFRYIGVEAAVYITERGITLEEYFAERTKSL